MGGGSIFKRHHRLALAAATAAKCGYNLNQDPSHIEILDSLKSDFPGNIKNFYLVRDHFFHLNQYIDFEYIPKKNLNFEKNIMESVTLMLRDGFRF